MVIAVDDEQQDRNSRIVRIAVPVVIVIGVAAAIFYAMHDTAGMRREAPPIATMVAVLPPPPPPPPPQKEKPPESNKVEPVEKVDQPKTDGQPKQITINGPAQAGTDAFGLAAGSGGGSVGSGGLEDGSYSRYLGSTIQQAVQQDDTLNRLVFSADIAIWVDETGHIAKVKVIRSSGDTTTDEALVAALQTASALEQPPASFQFPQRISVSGRRPG